MTDRAKGGHQAERFGLIGDIHAEDERLERALDLFERERVDAVLSVGDVVDGEGDVERCCELLAARGVVTVRGNHERWLLGGEMRALPHAHLLDELSQRSRSFLASLPATRAVDTAGGKLLLCHGVGDDDMKRLTPYDDGYELACNDALEELKTAGTWSFVVGGHTHLRMSRRFGDLLFVNPGTLCRDAPDPGCAILDVTTSKATFHDM